MSGFGFSFVFGVVPSRVSLDGVLFMDFRLFFPEFSARVTATVAMMRHTNTIPIKKPTGSMMPGLPSSVNRDNNRKTIYAIVEYSVNFLRFFVDETLLVLLLKESTPAVMRKLTRIAAPTMRAKNENVIAVSADFLMPGGKPISGRKATTAEIGNANRAMIDKTLTRFCSDRAKRLLEITGIAKRE